MNTEELEKILIKAIEYYFDGLSANEAIDKAILDMEGK